jgi:hypothetical protein
VRVSYALLLIAGGLLLAYSAFRTPPDPREVLGEILAGQAPRITGGGERTGTERIIGGGERTPPNLPPAIVRGGRS